ncbi:MAG: serine/threonine protein kinase, partial [Candidatus Rokuibacteriota bacterium]
MKDPSSDPNPLSPLELFVGRREHVKPLTDVAGIFRRVPTALERWNAVPGAVTLVQRAGSADGVPALAMEEVDGTPLGEVIRRAGVLDMARSIRLAIQLGEILEALHNVGLVHGDVRAETVLVVAEDESVLLTPPLHLLTRSAGPPVPRELDVPECADLLAFGVILYELLAGVAPYHRGSPNAVPQARGIAPMPLRKQRRGIPPPLERLVMELLSDRDLRQIDMSQIVNRLCIERERLRGRSTPGGTVRFTRQYRRVVAGAALAFFVAIGWLSAPQMPGLRRASQNRPPPSAITPAPLIPTRPDSAPAVGSPSVDAPVPSAPLPWPAVPGRTMDRGVDMPRLPAAARPRGRAGDSASVSAPRSRASGLTAHRGVAAGSAAIEAPLPLPAPPAAEWPVESPSEPSRTAEGAPFGSVAIGPLPAAADGWVRASPPPAEATMLAEGQRDGEVSAAIQTAPASPMPREADTPPDGSLALVPEVDVATTPSSMSTDPEPAVRAMLVRGALRAGSEAGPSALSTGHGARGAAGMIKGRLGRVARHPSERPIEQQVPLSGSTSAERFSALPGDGRHSR